MSPTQPSDVSHPPQVPTFDHLFASHRRGVLSLCRNIIGDRDEAEDALQETFLAVHRGLPGFRGECQPKSWVYRIATRIALRARAKRISRPTGLERADLVESTERPALGEQGLDRAWETLSPEQRTLLALFALKGLSHGEIAEVLGIPIGTVWSRLHSARRALSVALEQTSGDVTARRTNA